MTYHRGMRLMLAAPLKDADTDQIVTGYTMKCEVVYGYGKKKSLPLTYDATSQSYHLTLDTNEIFGDVSITFFAVAPSGDVIEANDPYYLFIHP